ncbi:Protein of unknown function [Bacillus wiedmannii]|nr:Protein of unknown function [Bacillus wiedmannii]
MQLMEYHLPL